MCADISARPGAKSGTGFDGYGVGRWRCGQLACIMGASSDGFEYTRRFFLFTKLFWYLLSALSFS